MRDRPQHKKLKRVPGPSTELSKLIELVNGLPDDARDTAEIEHDIRLANPSFGAFDVMKQVAARVEGELERTTDQVREYIGPIRDSHGLIIAGGAEGRYTRVIIAREVLAFIATQNGSAVEIAQGIARAINPRATQREVTRERLLLSWERLPEGLSEVGLRLVISEVPPESKVRPLSVHVRWEITDKRELKVFSIPKVQGIEETDSLRIRRCPRCDKFFFAGRMHQLAWPEPCAHILRTLRWREAYPEKYKQQRYKKAEARNAQTKRKRGI